MVARCSYGQANPLPQKFIHPDSVYLIAVLKTAQSVVKNFRVRFRNYDILGGTPKRNHHGKPVQCHRALKVVRVDNAVLHLWVLAT
ncbi:MAG: hypothetical protein ABFD08_05745 [Syntrophomonas sp.]